ncbi:MAG: DUF1318 domain-containing protein [Verrucomicrobiota bacterium]
MWIPLQHPSLRSVARLFASALIPVLLLSGCTTFDIDVGTEEPIKLDPIKLEPVDITMTVNVNHHTSTTKEEKTKAKNAADANERLRNRMAEVQELKNNRLIGENHLGLLSIRNLPGGEYGSYVQKTVDEENADRSYLMTSSANDRGVELRIVQTEQWRTNIQSAFAGEWIEVDGDVEGTYKWEKKS